MKETKAAYREVNGVSTQTNADSVQANLSPRGESVLYTVNPEGALTPNTSGYTTSKNQLTTSGK